MEQRPFWFVMNINGIHVITDTRIAPGRSHMDIAKAAVDAGAQVLQLRDKTISDKEFYEVALALRDMTRGTETLFIVNDRVDVAMAVGADGIHVGHNDLPAVAVRMLIGNNLILGVSATSIEEAVLADKDGADYIGYGPIFTTATKSDAAAPTGIQQLAALESMLTAPVVAIGGIGAGNVQMVAKAGADAAAVVSAVVCAVDMKEAVTQLLGLFRDAG
jgi:thiamine-phosphate pyrophosphorylase